MSTLIVPGVRVEARFDVLPPLPAPSGILGAVGIVDRPPAGTIGVTKPSEIRDLIGPGTQVTMPEVIHALANGASEAIISPVLGGSPASVTLNNNDDTPESALILRCRSNGSWGNDLRVQVTSIDDSEGNPVRVNIRLFIDGQEVESFSDLRDAPGASDDVFEAINRNSRYVVALDPGFEGELPSAGTILFPSAEPVDVTTDTADVIFQLLLAPGVAPDGLSVEIAVDGVSGEISMDVFQGGLQESLTGMVLNPDDDNYLPYVLETQSTYIRARSQPFRENSLPAATSVLAPFENGTSPSVDNYRTAIELLADDPRIDLVLASIEPARETSDVIEIHQALLAHCVTMADNGAPRIAFGTITADDADDLDAIRDHSAAVRNRRFVLIAPPGAAGVVAGTVGRLRPQFSPTFKNVPMQGIAPSSYRESQLNRLLGSTTNLLVVQQRAGRGVIVLRGLDTTGDQISVTRVADQAIRETKAISENFIGRLNTDEARVALRQQIVATFTRMERENALVPSTDGSDPAFLVDVYSTQQDFAQGIVRIDIAVRPVRAIDYIYASIRVKN